MKLVPWIRPALVAPFLTVAAFVTGSVLLRFTDPLLGSPFSNWLIGMVVGGLASALMSGTLLAVDLFLLRMNLRKPPEGRRAWLSALVLPLPVFVAYSISPPGAHEMGPSFVLAMILPILAAAVTVRLLASEHLAPP